MKGRENFVGFGYVKLVSPYFLTLKANKGQSMLCCSKKEIMPKYIVQYNPYLQLPSNAILARSHKIFTLHVSGAVLFDRTCISCLVSHKNKHITDNAHYPPAVDFRLLSLKADGLRSPSPLHCRRNFGAVTRRASSPTSMPAVCCRSLFVVCYSTPIRSRVWLHWRPLGTTDACGLSPAARFCPLTPAPFTPSV